MNNENKCTCNTIGGPCESPTTTNNPAPTPLSTKFTQFVNVNNLEDGSNTPDWILGEFLLSVLMNLNTAIHQRDQWYGVNLSPFGVNEVPCAPEEKPLVDGQKCEIGFEVGSVFGLVDGMHPDPIINDIKRRLLKCMEILNK